MKSKEELIQEIIKLLKQRYYRSEIKKHLLKQGYNENEIFIFIEEALRIHQKKNDKIRRYIFIGLTVLVFIVAFFILPIEFVEESPVIISIIISTLLVLLLFQSICNFRNFEELNPPKKPVEKFQNSVEDWRLSFGVIGAAMVSFLVLIFVFISIHDQKVMSELKEYGVSTKGIVINGSSTRVKNTSTYDINVNFHTLTDESIIVNKSVSAREFQRLYEGAEIDMIYSSRKPSIIELLLSGPTINTEDREITLEDLITVLNFETNEDAGIFLNKTSYGWAYDSIQRIWSNELKSIAIKFEPGLALMSANSGGLFFTTVYMNSDQLLTNMNFKRNPSENNQVKNYESDTYTISFTRQVDRTSFYIVTHIVKK